VNVESARLAALCSIASIILTACVITEEISIELTYGNHEQAAVAANALAVYNDDSCEILQSLPMALFFFESYRSEREHLQFFDEEGVAVGDLPEGTYSFVGLGLGDDCVARYAGCTVVELGGTDSILIRMEPISALGPVCGLISSCQSGECTGLN
jgi:hypothetical protein